MNKILYFPYISIPNTEWLSRAILYWDEVASIVPMDYIGNPELLDENMRKLVEYELVKQVIPTNYVYNIRNFVEDFEKIIDRHVRYIRNNRNNRFHREIKYVKIHVEKMGDIERKLSEYGLCIKDSYPWFWVEEGIAYKFMNYLAKRISQVEGYTPCTDKLKDLEKLQLSHSFSARNKYRKIILDEILPAPVGEVNPIEIKRFKEKHNDQLRKFRGGIEQFIISLYGLPKEVINERIYRFKKESLEEINELSNKMNENNLGDINLSNMCSVLASGIALMNRDYISGGLGLAASVGSLFNTQNNQIDLNHLAYAIYYKNRIRQFTK